jgi:two-component system response regulator PhoP
MLTAVSATARDSLRVLVVEDEDELRELTVSELSERGLSVTGLASAEALYRHLSVHVCDIVVLDVGLPGEDGYTVARHLRQVAGVGVVMLTGRGSAGDMVRGLDTGADLYLVKPVDMDVLAASITSLARRLAEVSPPAPAPEMASAPASGWSLGAGDWNLCPPDAAPLPLSESERSFLQTLFANPGTPVDRETLIQAITAQPWDFDPHRLEVLVHRLRARVRALTGLSLPVRAVRGAGYLYAES